MEVRYLGFEQQLNARAYRFDVIEKGQPARRFIVTADLALFLTSIKDIGLSVMSKATQRSGGAPVDVTVHIARVEAICDSFLAAYAMLMPVSRRRVALWEALDTFSLVLRSWDRVKPVRLANMLFLLDQHIRRHLA